MTNTTSNYWSADGVSLQTLARNISTLGPTYAPPPFRGEDQIIPGRVGSRWQPKDVDSRIIPFGMWVLGCDDSGNAPSPSTNGYKQFDKNWRQIARLLWTPGRQFELTKRFYDDDDNFHTATALAEFAGGLEPTMIGRRGARFTVNLKLADPYFYDDELTEVTLDPGTQDVTIQGDAVTDHIFFNMEGARSEPEIRNLTRDSLLKYNADLLSGDTVEIDVQNHKSLTIDAAHPGGFRTDVRITHSGAVPWFEMQPGINEIDLDAAGAGPIIMSVRSAWL